MTRWTRTDHRGCYPKEVRSGGPEGERSYSVGVAALILRMIRALDGSQRVMCRVNFQDQSKGIHPERNPNFRAKVDVMEEGLTPGGGGRRPDDEFEDLFPKGCRTGPLSNNVNWGRMVSNIKAPHILADIIASNPQSLRVTNRVFLETFDVRERLAGSSLLNKEVRSGTGQTRFNPR